MMNERKAGEIRRKYSKILPSNSDSSKMYLCLDVTVITSITGGNSDSSKMYLCLDNMDIDVRGFK